MKLTSLFLTCTTVGFLLTSCNHKIANQLNGEWDVVKMGNLTITPEAETPFLGYDGEKIYGFTGCNTFSLPVSAAELNAGQVDFGRTAMTMRSCPDNRYEAAFLENVRKVKSIEHKGDALLLKDNAGNVLMELAERQLTAQILNGRWNIAQINGKAVAQGEEVPFLGFDTAQSQLYGYTGCNRITGALDTAQALKGKLKLATLGSTRMLCPDARFETEMLATLGLVRRIELKGMQLQLCDAGGKVLMVLNRSEQP